MVRTRLGLAGAVSPAGAEARAAGNLRRGARPAPQQKIMALTLSGPTLSGGGSGSRFKSGPRAPTLLRAPTLMWP